MLYIRRDSPYVQDWSAQNFVQGMRVSYWSRLAFRPPGVFLERRHQNTRRSRVAAPADLEPPKGLGLGLGFGLRLGSGWSGPTCRVEIDHIRPAQSFVPTSPAHNDRGAPSNFGGVILAMVEGLCTSPRNFLLRKMKRASRWSYRCTIQHE